MALLDLPSELIATIFVFLYDEDIFSARLSNKDLERSSFAYFGKRFFRKKGFMITSPSLDVLQQIAEHKELRKYVQHVWFNPDCFTFAHPECCPEGREDGDLDEADELETPAGEAEAQSNLSDLLAQRYNAYQECMSDRDHLLGATGMPISIHLTERLASTFRHLPNLLTVGMRRSEDYSPYGWTELYKAVGGDPRVLGPIPSGPVGDLSGPTKLFVAIINALASTGVKLERLYTDAVEIDNILTIDLPEPVVQSACASILYLEFNAIRGALWWTSADVWEPYEPLLHPDGFGAGLSKLVKATPNLKEIGLQIFPDRKQSHLVAPSARDPESWRKSYPYLSFLRLANEASLPNLTRVKLEKFTTTSKTLNAFLKPSAANLTSLKIRDIRLLTSEQDERPWQTFFTFLLHNCQNLDHILLYHLMYERGGVAFSEIAPSRDASIEEEMLIDHVPQTLGGNAVFAGYDHITLEVHGKEEIKQKLEEVRTQHWYHPPLFSYAMDEDLWHTDTSDEEW